MARPPLLPTEPEVRETLDFNRGSTAPPLHLRWQRWHDSWRDTDRDLRWYGTCIVCRRNVYAFDDGENDPRGVLGDNALWTVSPGGDEGAEIRTCAICANDYGNCRKALELAARLGLNAVAPLAWPGRA